jgi:hypothetical protein
MVYARMATRKTRLNPFLLQLLLSLAVSARMAPTGWLDICGHFTIPKSDEAAQRELELFHSVDFMVSEPWKWTPEGQLPYLDRANV